MKRTIISTILIAVCYIGAFCQDDIRLYGDGIYNNNDMEARISSARQNVISGNINQAIADYSDAIAYQRINRSQGYQVNSILVCEYAYALALGHLQEKALQEIDLALSLAWNDNRSQAYYVAQILTAIGYPNLAKGFMHKEWKEPTWLKSYASTINDRLGMPSTITLSSPAETMKLITERLNENRTIEALVYAYEYTQAYPDRQAGHLILSSIWEKLRCYANAYDAFIQAKTLGDNMTDKTFSTKEETLKKKADKKGNDYVNAIMSSLIYGGIGYNNSGTTISGRYGIYSGPVSFSADVNITIPKEGDVTTYFGASMNYRWRTLFFGIGLGLMNDQFSITPTAGLSFINKARTSSFDISITYIRPFSSGANASMGISVGKTFYF